MLTMTISQAVKEILKNNTVISQMLSENLLSVSTYSRRIKAKVESLVGKSVNESAIVMALRRAEEEARIRGKRKIDLEYEMMMKSSIFDMSIKNTGENSIKIMEILKEVRSDSSAFFNFSLSQEEINITLSEKYRALVAERIKECDIISRCINLSGITITFSGNFLETPGVIYLALSRLARDGVNITEIFSTLNELTFIINSADAARAYSALESFLLSDFIQDI